MSLVLSFLFNTASNLFDSCAKEIILMKSKNLTVVVRLKMLKCKITILQSRLFLREE